MIRATIPGLIRFAAGGAAALAAAFWLPLAAEDPLHGTLLVLPIVLAGLAEFDARARAAGARAIPRRTSAWQLTIAGALVLAALLRPHLGLHERSAAIVMAGFVLLLAHRLLRELIRLRPLLGSRLPRHPSTLFLLLPFLAYLALLPWSTERRPPDGDEPYYLLITHSLAYDLDAELTDEYEEGAWRSFMNRPLEPQPGDPVGPHGELYSRHNALLPLALALPYRLGGKMAALLGMALLAAALAWSTLALAYHYLPDRPGETLLAYGLTAFLSPLLLYSYQVWVEVPAALLATLALSQILALRQRRISRTLVWGPRQWWGIALPILLLPLVKIRFMLLAGPLVALAWWHAGRPRKPLIVLAVLLVVVGGGVLLHNQMLYGNPLKIHHWQELELHHYGLGAYAEGTFGLFWDAAFGLFGSFPVWLLLLPAVVLTLVRRQRLPLHLLVLTGPYLLIVVPRSEWYGGWSPPFRYALVALPLLALILAPLLAHRRRGGARALSSGLLLLTLGLTLVWVAVPGWTYDFADGSTYLLDHLSQRLGTDVGRLFPSYLRPRSAAWLWPLATVVLVPLFWWWPRRLPGAGAWGAAALLAAVAMLPWAAARLPTRVVELEDGQVTKSGGHVFPDLWVTDRTLYPGGWVLRQGESLTVPVTPGGRRVVLSLVVNHVRADPAPFRFEVRAGERVLGRFDADRWPAGWQRVEMGPVAWPAGAPLVIETDPAPGPLRGIALDRVELSWR